MRDKGSRVENGISPAWEDLRAAKALRHTGLMCAHISCTDTQTRPSSSVHPGTINVLKSNHALCSVFF